MMNQGQVTYYRIKLGGNHIRYDESDLEQLYTNAGPDIIRKAIFANVQSSRDPSGIFTDKETNYQVPDGFRLVRLYDLYKKEVDLFPYDETQSSYLTPQQQYNSFMAESGIVSYLYLKTLFLTQRVTRNGYYQYFVKRNGQYFIDECDDLIPVDRVTWKPIWGLNLAHPWQIMLFKVWWKQCGGSISEMYRRQPFSLLDAFGLPQYILYNFRKQYKFMQGEKGIVEKSRMLNISRLPMYKTNASMIGRTVDSPAIQKLGLVRNCAGYKIKKQEEGGPQQIYTLFSALPTHWVGQYSPVHNSKLNRLFQAGSGLDLQRKFLINSRELMTCFNKFYIAPEILAKMDGLIIQDCLNLQANGRPLWVRFFVNSENVLALSIEHPKVRTGPNNRYPQFRYFFTKRNDEYEKSQSHIREDIAGSKLEQNMYVTSNCDKWSYYRIDYVQGYESRGTFFTQLIAGEYVLFIDTEHKGQVNLRIDSFARMDRPQVFQPTQVEKKEIFDSTFFSISRDEGVEAGFNLNSFDESITLNNSFEQHGFGSICIKTLQKAKYKVAMRVYPEKLRAAGLRTISQYDSHVSTDGQSGKQKNYVFVSAQGRPEIIVLERIDNRSRSQIGERFPPQGTVEFFRVFPNSTTIINQNIVKKI